MTQTTHPLPPVAAEVLHYWLADGIERDWPSTEMGKRWFGGGAEQDAEIEAQFGPLVAAALDISRRTVRKIRQNLFWAFAYNVAGIPLAALGFLSPVVGGAAMALSSVRVVSNALLLKRWKPPL